MEATNKNPNVYNCCVAIDSRLNELKSLSDELERRQKSLSDYLDTKRNYFARFYFLSDEDLLSILGTSEPREVQQHMLKLFDNCKSLKIKGKSMVTGMESEEGEVFYFKEAKKAEKPVEGWMIVIDEEMQSTLHAITKEAVFNYPSIEKNDWMLNNLGMIAIVGS